MSGSEPYQKLGPPPASLQVTHTVARVSDKAQWRNSTTSWRRCRTNAACLAAQNRSARLVQDVQDIRARMQPWQGTQAVKVLDERLGEYGLRVGVGR